MGYIKDAQRRAKEIRARLRYPKNWVWDPESGSPPPKTKKVQENQQDEPCTATVKVQEITTQEQIPATISFGAILSLVSGHLGLNPYDLKGACRRKELSDARHIAVYLATQFLKNHTLTTIARGLNKDHTSIIYARDKVTANLPTDSVLASTVAHLEVELRDQYRL